MSEHAMTRRGFLAGSAGVAAAVACGYAGLESGTSALPAFAVTSDAAGTSGKTTAVHTLCNACSSKCGYTAYVVDGKLDKLVGDASNPHSGGKLCARGYGYSQIAYSADRLTEPLKKTESGKFEAISWEQAYAEIAERISAIIEANGPQALAAVHDPRPSGKYYVSRFMKALGSPNVYTHGAACNLSKVSGFKQVIGASDYESDVENAKMVMFIGRSYADAIRPSQVAALRKVHEAGARIVLVDPRCNGTIALADEWVPVNPGTDMALVLAMSQVLISQGLYDAAYVAEQSVGFDEWASAISGCTPEWAAEITGVPASTIRRLAAEFAEAAPAASIEQGWRGAFGCAYANSGETARAICAFNTLLGCWNQKGGALLTKSVSAGELDEAKFPKVPSPEGELVGTAEYPLAVSSMGSNVFAAEAAKGGRIKGMLFYNSNMAAGYANPAYLAEALGKLDLMVVIDVQMSETAQLADYVLPECSYLERMEIPEFTGGKLPAVSLRDQVLDVVHEGTRPVDVIISQLGAACGVGDYFNFTVEELADAQLQTVGLSLATLRKVGTVTFPEAAFEYGTQPTWNTPTGKIQFTSEACAAAGYSATPTWVAPATAAEEGKFRLVGGKQPIHSHTQTANIPELMNITEEYDLTRIWMNAEDAAALGIEDGDTVLMENDQASGKTRVKVTQRIMPGVIFMPSHYGCTSPELKTAYGKGLRMADFVPFAIEPGYGSAMSQETLVEIAKVGA